MTCQQILTELQAMGNEAIKRIFKNHGAPEPLFGVKVQDLKKLQKKIKKNYELSLELFNTGNSDARYLAGLIADETKMTRHDLQHWVQGANWPMQSEYVVAWIAAESKHGLPLALEWIDAAEDKTQASGWSTLANLVTLKPDDQLDIVLLQQLLKRVEKEIHGSANRTRYAMNSFVIAAGCCVNTLTANAKATGTAIGKVMVDVGGTACIIPYAPDYIEKAAAKGVLGKKKKKARC